MNKGGVGGTKKNFFDANIPVFLQVFKGQTMSTEDKSGWCFYSQISMVVLCFPLLKTNLKNSTESVKSFPQNKRNEKKLFFIFFYISYLKFLGNYPGSAIALARTGRRGLTDHDF